MDGGAWWATVYEVAKSRTRLSDQAQTKRCKLLCKICYKDILYGMGNIASTS